MIDFHCTAFQHLCCPVSWAASWRHCDVYIVQ